MEERAGDADGGIKFATLWPLHHQHHHQHQHHQHLHHQTGPTSTFPYSSLTPASAVTLNLMMQPNFPATIAHQLIAQALMGSAGASQSKASRGDSSRSGTRSLALSPSAAADQSFDNLAADSEVRARELYGDFAWIVQPTQTSDDVGSGIQVSWCCVVLFVMRWVSASPLHGELLCDRFSFHVFRLAKGPKGNGLLGATGSSFTIKLVDIQGFKGAYLEDIHVSFIKFLISSSFHCSADRPQIFRPCYGQKPQIHHIRICVQSAMRFRVLVSSVVFLR